MAYVANTMPMANCSFCQLIRTLVGRMPRDEVITCPDCLVSDWTTVRVVGWGFHKRGAHTLICNHYG